MRLPSFLEKHPRLAGHGDLRHWCAKLTHLKARRRPERVLLLEGHAVMAEDRGAYLAEMGRMTAEFK